MLSWVCRGQQTFSVKGQRVNILGFVGHGISVATTQLCCWRVKTDIYMNIQYIIYILYVLYIMMYIIILYIKIYVNEYIDINEWV